MVSQDLANYCSILLTFQSQGIHRATGITCVIINAQGYIPTVHCDGLLNRKFILVAS